MKYHCHCLMHEIPCDLSASCSSRPIIDNLGLLNKVASLTRQPAAKIGIVNNLSTPLLSIHTPWPLLALPVNRARYSACRDTIGIWGGYSMLSQYVSFDFDKISRCLVFQYEIMPNQCYQGCTHP